MLEVILGDVKGGNGQMRTAKLYKYHILGNSYLVVPPSEYVGAGTDKHGGDLSARLPGPFVETACSLDYGVGSSGVVFGPLKGSSEDRIGLHIYNQDGTFCNFSGNATRIFARYLVDSRELDVSLPHCFELEVFGLSIRDDSVRPVINTAVVHYDPSSGGQFSIDLPPPAVGKSSVFHEGSSVSNSEPAEGAPDGVDAWLRLPCLSDIGSRLNPSKSWASSCFVNVGNPHCITFVDSMEDLPAADFSDTSANELMLLSYAGTRGHPLATVFPDGCNLQFAFFDSSTRFIHLRTFERGGGPSKASGSSSAATAIAAFSRGLVGEKVSVCMPGGTMNVTMQGTPGQVSSTKIDSVVSFIGSIEMQLPARGSAA